MGLGYWFTLPGKPETPPPSRHKMALLIVLAAYPTVLALHVILSPVVGNLPYPLAALIGSVCLVLVLTYVVMPWVTRVFHRWLYPGER